MAISIINSDVKRKCMISASDTTYDTSIGSLISEMQPALEYTIDDACLSNTSDTRMQAALKLGMLEIISGEFLQQLEREFGSTEQISIAGLTIGEVKGRGSVLIQQGTARLVPFLKTAVPASEESSISSSTKSSDRMFTLEDSGWKP